VIFITDISERKRLEEALREQAFKDELTGVSNRAFFDAEVARLEKGRDPIGICFLDVDGLKKVNDAGGHLHGAILLKRVGDIVQHTFRGDDITARYGGDEFVALIPKATDDMSQIIAQRLREKIVESNKKHNGFTPVSLSFGIVIWDPQSEEKETLWEAIIRADAVMYKQKEAKKKQRI
jgi:diguanylate cyclase (GGDEF)-like protein